MRAEKEFFSSLPGTSMQRAFFCCEEICIIPRMRSLVLLIAAFLMSGATLAQEQSQPEPKKPVYVSPSARLAAAKTVFMKNAGGSEVPFNVISAAVEGWARFRPVDSPEEADIEISVRSPDDEHTSSSGSKTRVGTGGVPAPSSPPNTYDGPIKLVVSDAHTHLTLWAASDQPKGGFRQHARDEHLVEAAERLVTKLRERLDAAAAPK